MKILAVETSCDETAMAVIEAEENQPPKVLANLVRSQIKLHQPYGGVFPNLAKREHQRVLPILWRELLKTYHLKPKTLNLIAVTQGPGLAPCLWQGIEFTKKLSKELNVPLVGVNHLKGHIFTVFQPTADQPQAGPIQIKYPILSLIVSGGHTELVWSERLGHYEIVGATRDDAAGEAFDKVARLLGLGYPGGPEISRLAEKGNPERFDLPRPMIDSNNFDFSFAGLKTAVVYLVRGINPSGNPLELTDPNKADLAASFQKAAVDVLVQKTIRATQNLKPRTLILGGGVAANKLLRQELERNVTSQLQPKAGPPRAEETSKLILPDPKLTGDNALMIALAAWYERDFLKPETDLEARPNLKITEK